MTSGEDGVPVFRALYTKLSAQKNIGHRNQGIEVRMVKKINKIIVKCKRVKKIKK